jgi:transcription antitermination factor NusG
MTENQNTPPSRFPDRPIDQAQAKWWIAKVKPRQEKQLAFDFLNFGIEYYLPLFKNVTFRPGTNKKRTFIVPLFPGYICFSQDIPKDIYRTGRVVNLIEIRHQKRFIKELSQIYLALEQGFTIEPVDCSFEIESKVEIISGTLKGVRGVVANIKDNRRMILSVDGLGQAAVQVDMGQVKAIDSDD